MIHIDFSPQPCNRKRDNFYGVWIPIAILILITVLNIVVFIAYRFRNSDIHQQISSMDSEISLLQDKTTASGMMLSREKYKVFIQKYNFLNHITHKKMLRWSSLLNSLGSALPPSVKITVISPSVKQGRVSLSISGEALTKADELLFVANLQKSIVFDDAFIDFEAIDAATHNLKFSLSVRYGRTP
ncbi:MAG: PilN domain-containing protein [Acidobacteria bacterium]|nr:PilN domain-containing protein [Acidobacteriota bacterium]